MNLVNSAYQRGKADEIPWLTAGTQLNFRGLIKSWINRSNVMNLWILHYSFINHQFHHSTITIKQKIIINKLVGLTELLWGHFLWKNSCSNEKRQNSAGKKRLIPRWNFAAQFRWKHKNSAARHEIPRSRNTVGPSQGPTVTCIIKDNRWVFNFDLNWGTVCIDELKLEGCSIL